MLLSCSSQPPVAASSVPRVPPPTSSAARVSVIWQSIMLRRAVSLLSGHTACLRRQPVTATTTSIRRHPDARLGVVDARGIVRMARQIPPVRPDGYSTSDGETDAFGDDEDREPVAGADGEDEEEVELDAFTVDLGKGTFEEHTGEEEEEEEGEK